MLEAVTAERDELAEQLTAAKQGEAELVDQAQRLKAEFDNFRKRSEAENTKRAADRAKQLADQLLGVLDACDAAVGHGETAVAPIAKLLMDKLGDAGLIRIVAVGEPFDPTEHEALRHESGPPPADGSAELWVVSEERAGYRFGEHVLRAAQVIVGSQAGGQGTSTSVTSPDTSAEGT